MYLGKIRSRHVSWVSFESLCCCCCCGQSFCHCLIFTVICFQTLCLVSSSPVSLSKSSSSTQSRFKGRFGHDLLTLSSALPVSQSFLSKQTNKSLIFYLQEDSQTKIWWIWCENMKSWWNICYERTFLKAISL